MDRLKEARICVARAEALHRWLARLNEDEDQDEMQVVRDAINAYCDRGMELCAELQALFGIPQAGLPTHRRLSRTGRRNRTRMLARKHRMRDEVSAVRLG